MKPKLEQTIWHITKEKDMKFELSEKDYATIIGALTSDCWHYVKVIKEAVMKDDLDEDLIMDCGEAIRENRNAIAVLLSQFDKQKNP